ncbi:hypothetical protein NKH18_45325 [Streptomyces sp. M10(2022)]
MIPPPITAALPHLLDSPVPGNANGVSLPPPLVPTSYSGGSSDIDSGSRNQSGLGPDGTDSAPEPLPSTFDPTSSVLNPCRRRAQRVRRLCPA